MLDKNTVGLWCRKDNTFYYLEAGPHSHNNTLDRVKKVLVARGLVEFSTEGTKLHEEPYKRMSYIEAQEKKLDVKPIYLNRHIKKVTEAVEAEPEGSPWD